MVTLVREDVWSRGLTSRNLLQKCSYFIEIDYIVDYYHWFKVSVISIIHNYTLFFIKNMNMNMNKNFFKKKSVWKTSLKMSISMHIKKFLLLTHKYSKLLCTWTSPKYVCFFRRLQKVLCMCWLWHLLFTRFVFYKTRPFEL